MCRKCLNLLGETLVSTVILFKIKTISKLGMMETG